MGFLDWMKQRTQRTNPEPEDEPVGDRHHDTNGSPIKPLWQSEWQPDDLGVREFRHHVGKSSVGFHGGLEISVGGGESVFRWTHARETPEEAENASYGMREGWEWADSTPRMTPLDKGMDQTKTLSRSRSKGIEY